MGHSSQSFSLKEADVVILAVDDEPRMLDSLLACLKPYRLNIDTALGGARACEKLLAGHYDLVLLDLNMPDIDGHQVLEFAAEHGLRCPFIVVSGESSFDAVTKALRHGVSDYLKKPYSVDELVTTVSNVLQQQLLQKEHNLMQLRLQQSEGLHRYIVNSSPDIIFMLDKRGRITFINEKVEALLGYKRSELIGRPCLNLIDHEDRNKAIYYYHKGAAESQGGANFEICLRRKGPSHLPRHFDITLFPVDNSQLVADHISGVSGSVIYGAARDITEQKEAEEFISFQAYHDTLTRLPNRALFKDRLSLAINQATRNKQMLAVMFLDLDRFKNINDTLGHSIGDLLLEKVARRLELVLRSGDTLSRFGGDEFTLLLPALNSNQDAMQIAEKIIATLREPFDVDGMQLFVGVSIGIALYPESGSNIEQLIKNADQAMYHVKERGKDGYCFYAASMSDDLSRQVKLERDLRVALEANQFVVYYQPLIEIATGAIVGVEALVRWQHPERGVICPVEFITFAEETRLINEIGRRVLVAACTEVKRWIDITGHKLRLAVNFSPVQMDEQDFVDLLHSVLQETGFPVEMFELELTENTFIHNLDHIAGKIERLVDHGMTVAIDDFGTGYSSLNYLNKLPIHTLKIDRCFIQQIPNLEDGSSCVVNAITAMAKGLHLNIVAEGVETREQLDYVRELGCNEAQGFYCGRPQPGEAVLDLIAAQQQLSLGSLA
ncbi:MAG: EAL domain-containing protein [Gammaproteobacteria bacterium]|nr:EAL domain-containing protein [Gammaproteobacteria bacterium]